MSEAEFRPRLARDDELEAIAELVNAGYRGEGGWTNETAFLEGSRTSPEALRNDLVDHPRAALLVLEGTTASSGGAIGSVVRLQSLGGDLWEIGMMTVHPERQDRKLGRRMLAAAEAMIADGGGRCIEITVINIRVTLIAWYRRRGYRETGELRSFPYRGSPLGTPIRGDLAFVVMQKAGGLNAAG